MFGVGLRPLFQRQMVPVEMVSAEPVAKRPITSRLGLGCPVLQCAWLLTRPAGKDVKLRKTKEVCQLQRKRTALTGTLQEGFGSP